ncbi:predicted protein [Sclerotinia sclerotiorum 1980 UF-70]|uniref:Uncharacterized protein n=1 Tax=Sclerotinia sclerotiorum (strain ATCC 18683 / 1980 / Ss-1) TaxID=665079 RepID=A7F2M0_SCLS1|nr:predicted protein [Sclerotinia sclerotiorum 1980 UF-70]EDN95962.1 predicted protein [Sclerotinia sclerotiorum 1980 UF-70]
MTFFPQGIYNGDLLMMIGTAAKTPKPYQALAQAGTTLQAPFDPFSDLWTRSEEDRIRMHRQKTYDLDLLELRIQKDLREHEDLYIQ